MLKNTQSSTAKDNNIRAESSDVKQRLILAAQTCYEKNGIKRTTINDIAKTASITRRTVYRYFSSHDDILLAVFERIVDTFWQDLFNDLAFEGDFGECIATALLYSINYAKTTKRHGYMFSNDAQAITNNIYISNYYFIEASYKGLTSIHQEKVSQGLAKEDIDLQMLAEWFNRLILSFVSTPSKVYQSDQELLTLFRSMLTPINN